MTEEQFSKLPKFAQEAIAKLRRERDVAIRALNEYCDNQTPSRFFIEEHESTGEQIGPSVKVRHIQTHRISLVHRNVRLDVYALEGKDIEMSWASEDRAMRDIAMIPESFCRVRLSVPENMR